MTKNLLTFKDHANQDAKDKWLQKEIKDCIHTYPIPSYNSPIPMSFSKGPLVAIDIGANVGSFCIYAAAHFEKIYAFEAIKNTFKVAQENTQNFNNVKIYNLAVGKNDGEYLKFASHTSDLSGNASQFIELEPYIKDGVPQIIEECKTISLEGIYDLCNIDYIDYLKIDCEGSEYDFLMGKDLSRINFMVMEIHPGCLGKRKTSQLLQYLNKYFIFSFNKGQFIFFYKSKKEKYASK
jgi:FkbM family methyltransferase